MSVTLDKEIAKQTFLDGSRYLAELAEQIHRAKGLDHFIHIVDFMSPYNDDNIDMQANVFDFDNFMKGESEYERMKFLADLYIRQQAKLHGYPLSVVNPSTVIGASPPGFGRSPVMQDNKVFSGYLDALCKAIAAAPSRIRLVGHSFGAVIAAKAAQAMPRSIEQLYLLQPVLHHPHNNTLRHRLSASVKIAKLLLIRISVGGYTRTMLREGVFAEPNEIPDGYVKAMKRNLSSPRIAAANAAMLHVLEHGLPLLDPNKLSATNTSIIWGTKDKAYVLPKAFQQINPQFISYGHQFPVSYPVKTAELLERLIIDLEWVTNNQVS
jgi:pimeloyl-ACP methyl ester carboxylesterase